MCKDLEATRHHFHSELGCWLPGTLGLEACEQKAAAWFQTLGLWGLKFWGLKGVEFFTSSRFWGLYIESPLQFLFWLPKFFFRGS